jgi:hypothetical protein
VTARSSPVWGTRGLPRWGGVCAPRLLRQAGRGALGGEEPQQQGSKGTELLLAAADAGAVVEPVNYH